LLPLASCPHVELAAIKAVLTDIDDTLTTGGRLPAIAYAAMARLAEAGIKVIPVTGRPAGWCDLIARQWPVEAVVGENGAFYFRYDQRARAMRRVYAQDAATRTANQRKLFDLAREILRKYPGTALASDQAYREIDVAIDFREDVPPLSREAVDRIVDLMRAEGMTAKVSSIHVNGWFGGYDKLSMMSLRTLSEVIEIESESAAYCGDSANDEPMFAYFSKSFGVANVRPFLPMMMAHPAYIAEHEGGEGFAEFAVAVLAAR
jgi:HAD superfamily hydrolase (TIGR01484 family)